MFEKQYICNIQAGLHVGWKHYFVGDALLLSVNAAVVTWSNLVYTRNHTYGLIECTFFVFKSYKSIVAHKQFWSDYA